VSELKLSAIQKLLADHFTPRTYEITAFYYGSTAHIGTVSICYNQQHTGNMPVVIVSGGGSDVTGLRNSVFESREYSP